MVGWFSDLEIRFDRGKSERSRELVWLSGSFGANLRRPFVVVVLLKSAHTHTHTHTIRSELMMMMMRERTSFCASFCLRAFVVKNCKRREEEEEEEEEEGL